VGAAEDLEGKLVDEIRHEQVEQAAGEFGVLLMEGELDAVDPVGQAADREADRSGLVDTVDAEAEGLLAGDEGAAEALVLAEERLDALPVLYLSI